MRLVNYIRSEVEVGNTAPNLSNESAFQDEKYLLPVLEDDPLLYSLHDAIGEDFDDIDDSLPLVAGKTLANHTQDTKPVIDLERKLQRAQLELDACRREVEELRSQAKFHDNHVLPMKTIPEVTGHVDIDAMSLGEKQSKTRGISDTVDSSYFASYSGHGMLAWYVLIKWLGAK